MRAEGPGDPLMHGPRPLLFAQREGRVLEALGDALQPAVVVGCTLGGGGPVDTLALPVLVRDADLAAYEHLRRMLRRAVTDADTALLGRVSTASARLRQRVLPRPDLPALTGIADSVGAVGVQIAHSGNVRHNLHDTAHWLVFDEALAGRVDLLRRHAVFTGLSTGAGYLAARWERREEPGRTALFVAADTGHRYVDTVFTRHREAAPIEDLTPRPVRGTDELALPWSRMSWSGAFAPEAAVLGQAPH